MQSTEGSRARFQVCKTHDKHGGEAYFVKLCCHLISELFAISLIFISENIYLSGNFKWKKHSFKPLCWNVNENYDWFCASYQSKNSRKKTTLQVFSVRFTRPVSPLGIHGTLLLPLILVTATAKRKHYSRLFAFIRVELRALLSCGLLSRVHKERSCKVKILICA